jgi:hypothetical protein
VQLWETNEYSTKTTSLEIFHGDRRRVVNLGRMVRKGCPFINDGMAAPLAACLHVRVYVLVLQYCNT